jgi:hypothetical protein
VIVYYGQLFEITKVAYFLGQLLSAVKVMQYFFRKNGFGYNLGNFFQKLIWSHWRSMAYKKDTKPLICKDKEFFFYKILFALY